MKNAPYPFNKIDTTLSTISEMMVYCEKKYADLTAFRFKEKQEIKSVSYKKFALDVKALGFVFRNMGLQNAKIAIVGENSYLWLVTYFAATSGGHILVPFDAQLPCADIEELLLDSDASVFIYSNSFSDVAETIQKSNTAVNHFIDLKKDMPSLLEKAANDLQQGKSEYNYAETKENDMALIVYTSGTTGKSKGVMLSHKNIMSNSFSGYRYVDLDRHDYLILLPLHHTLSSTPGVVAQLIGGCTLSICSSLKNAGKDIMDFKPLYTIMVPQMVEVMYKKIWDTARKENKEKLLKTMIKISNTLLKGGIDLRRKLFKSVLAAFGGKLEWALCGGAPLQTEYVDGFRNFGIEILQAYGITECSPGVSLNRYHHHRDGSVGLVLDCCKVKISEPDKDGIGEILVKGDNVMLGYYKNEEATKEAFDGEWFKTGDLGYIDKDGFLFITGRIKNLIILNNGKNVSPEELETAVSAFEYVIETLVYGDGDKIIAEIFPDFYNFPNCSDRIDVDILALNRTLPQYKNISKTIIRDTEFPKTTSKKIKRNN